MDDKNLSNLINSLSPDDIQSLQSVAQSLFGGQNQAASRPNRLSRTHPYPRPVKTGRRKRSARSPESIRQ